MFFIKQTFPLHSNTRSVTSAFVRADSKSPANTGKEKPCCCNPEGDLLTFVFRLSFTRTYSTRQRVLLCVRYLWVLISASSYSGWGWLMWLQHHALALGVPHESLPGPRFVTVRFSGCSWGDSGAYHEMRFPLFHIEFHHDSNDTEQGNINERFLSERPGTMCMCIHARVCLCVTRLRFHWLRTDLPLRKSNWFPAKVK